MELSLDAKILANYSVVGNVLAKKVDVQLSVHGINFSEFMVLFQLAEAKSNVMRRIDLAERTGLSASGITRLVSPMERIGLVEKEASSRDARVSLVKMTEAGRRILAESCVTLNAIAGEVFVGLKEKDSVQLFNILRILGGNVA